MFDIIYEWTQLMNKMSVVSGVLCKITMKIALSSSPPLIVKHFIGEPAVVYIMKAYSCCFLFPEHRARIKLLISDKCWHLNAFYDSLILCLIISWIFHLNFNKFSTKFWCWFSAKHVLPTIFLRIVVIRVVFKLAFVTSLFDSTKLY